MKTRATILSLLVLAAFLVPDARAADDGVRWTPTIKDALKEAKDRGALVLVCETLDGDPACDGQKTEWKDPAFAKISRLFVCVYANPRRDHGTMEVTVDGKKVRRCRDAPTVTCDDHTSAWNEIYQNYAKLNTNSVGDMKLPFHFVLDANGEVVAQIMNGSVEGGFEAVPAATLVSQLNDLLRKFGKPLDGEEYAKLKEKLAEAERAQKGGESGKALKLCAEIIEANGKTTLADRAREIRENVAKAGEPALGEAFDLAEKDPLAALEKLEALADEYPDTDLAARAKKKIADLKNDPRVKKQLAELAAQKDALKQLARAEEYLKKENYAKALSLLDEVAEKYAGTAAGSKAKARAEALRADGEIMRRAREQEAEKVCKGWLSMARSYAKNGMVDQARAKYEEIIEKYPGTSFAEEAQRELEKLK